MNPKKFAGLITARREAAKMTQEELARRAKLSRGYLAKLEAGHSKNPSLLVLGRLAKALNLPLAELLE
jgi:XRE family transcriptional regulator of biofilm formation